MKIGLDIDGVFADFVGAYNQLIKEQTGIQMPPSSDSYPDIWEYDVAAGLTPKQLSHLWGHIRSTHFWAGLHALPGAVEALERLWLVNRDHDIYFITSRPGATSKYQTELWLSWHGFPKPTVLIANGAQEKALLARGLRLQTFIEDNSTNLATIINEQPLDGYLLDKPYNRGKEERSLAGMPFTRILTLKQGVDVLLAEKVQQAAEAA